MMIPFDEPAPATTCVDYCGRTDGTHDPECPYYAIKPAAKEQDDPALAQAIAEAVKREPDPIRGANSRHVIHSPAFEQAFRAHDEANVAAYGATPGLDAAARAMAEKNRLVSVAIGDADFPQDLDRTEPHRAQDEATFATYGDVGSMQGLLRGAALERAVIQARIDTEFPLDVDWTKPHRFVPEPVAEGEEPLDQCFGCNARMSDPIHDTVEVSESGTFARATTRYGHDDFLAQEARRDTVDGREAIIDGTVPREPAPLVPRVTREEKIETLRRAFITLDGLQQQADDLKEPLKTAKAAVDRAARAVAESDQDGAQLILGETTDA